MGSGCHDFVRVQELLVDCSQHPEWSRSQKGLNVAQEFAVVQDCLLWRRLKKVQIIPAAVDVAG